MKHHDNILELLSRGLDADLDRQEMRLLYRLAAQDESIRQEMADLANMEEGMAQWAITGNQAQPAQPAQPAQLTDPLPPPFALPASQATLWEKLAAWFVSPHSVSLQPISFMGGLGVAMLLYIVAVPSSVVVNSVASQPRLQIHDVQFTQAKARVDWTERFIIDPNTATVLTLPFGGNRPVYLQFETVAATHLTVIHNTSDGSRDTFNDFTIDGIGYASLRQPLPGEKVSIRNHGKVPVVVYLRSMHGATLSHFQESGHKSQDL